MNKKVLVTGGSGFIGGHLVKLLKGKEYDVEIIDIVQGPEDDVRDLERIKERFKGVDTVFHLAALPSVPYSIERPDETNEVNLGGTLNVLIAARESGVRRVVFSSSAAVYGDQEILPVEESFSPKPKSPYALQKLGSEMYLKLFSDLYNLETLSLRYFNVYGEGQDPTGPYASVIPKFIEQKKSGKPLTIVGDGLQTRDFVHVSDVALANLLAMESKIAGKGETINIASGQSVSVSEIGQLIGGPLEYLPPRLEIKDSLADISLAKKLLNWEPKISLEEGIQELLK